MKLSGEILVRSEEEHCDGVRKKLEAQLCGVLIKIQRAVDSWELKLEKTEMTAPS